MTLKENDRNEIKWHIKMELKSCNKIRDIMKSILSICLKQSV